MSSNEMLEVTSSGQGVHFIGSSSSRTQRKQQTVQGDTQDPVEQEEEDEGVDEALGEFSDEYETTDFISMPIYSLESTFDKDPLELEHSYGYDCTTANLCVVDPDTLLWSTGNIIHIFNAKTRRLSFRRSALAQNISCIIKSKSTDEFAIAENGGPKASPVIIIYRWPDFKVCSVLRGGSTSNYKSIDFSCDGTKLVSQAGPPSDTLTIWDIRHKSSIISLQNLDSTVKKALFSTYDPDAFVTCGDGHLKFWRLVETFTGLKIDSSPGRFGEIDNNDVSAVCFLPEGRVLTNFCGGNFAVWKPDASLELSFSMKDSEPCHSDVITFIQTYLKDNHLYTTGLDGKVRVWNYSYMSGFFNSDSNDCLNIVINPSYERNIEEKKGRSGFPLQLLPKDDQLFPYHYYMQDVKGGIWLLDLELKKSPDPWIQLYSCHAGQIHDMSASPGDYFLATVGSGGKMSIYSHTERNIVLTKQFKEEAVVVLWLPFSADPTGSRIIAGFVSGIIKVVAVLVKDKGAEQLRIVQAMKPHSAAITALTINKKGTLIVTGSEDQTIFLCSFNRDCQIVPLGAVQMNGSVTDIFIEINHSNHDMILVSCSTGKVTHFVINQANKEIIKKSSENDETYVIHGLSRCVTEVLHRGKSCPKRYFARYMGNRLIWIEDKSSTHSNHNYLYNIGGSLTAKLNISDGHTVQCVQELHAGRYMVLGLNNGVIKVIKRSTNFADSWQIVMHNSKNCEINKICASYDQKILYSCGSDSGLFAYKVNLDVDVPVRTMPYLEELPNEIDDVDLQLSLEEEKIERKEKMKREKHQKRVDTFKERLNTFLTMYYRVIQINKCLPKCLRIPKDFFRLQLQEQRLLERREMWIKRKKDLAPLVSRQKELFDRVRTIKKHFTDTIKTHKFYVFAIRRPNYLKSFPERKLFSKDPLGEDSDFEGDRDKRWERLFDDKSTTGEQTEFERMMNKVVTKLAKVRDMEVNFDHCRDANLDKEAATDDREDEIPDLITAAGAFLIETNTFTQTQKTVFQRINANRLKRMKCIKEMSKLDKMKAGFRSYYERADALFNKLIKTETKGKDKAPLVMERLHHALCLRQRIYICKEQFNRSLRQLRKEKTDIINYYYWAQVEYKYMIDDLKLFGMDLAGIEMPKPIEVIWDLEYPDRLNFKPNQIPNDIQLRMELYKKNLDKINKLIPINKLSKQILSVGVTNHRLFQIIKYRKECFWNSMIIIREKLDSMITDFDDQFRSLLLKRSKTSMEINLLTAEYSSTLQEVDILYRYDIMQTSASRYKCETIRTKHIYILRENIRRKKLSRFNDKMKESLRTIEDLNAKFAESVKDDKWAKHLTRTYKRKYKLPKGGSDETILSSESSSDDDDLDDDFDEDGTSDEDDDRGEAGAAVAYIYDETIVPPGCDEEKFRNTFKLRSLRHAEELRIAEIKKEKEIILEEVKNIKKVIKTCDGLLALYYSGTFRFLKMMNDEMNDIDYLLFLDPSQIQIFDKNDPMKNVPLVEDCKLIEQEDYLLKTKTLRQLKDAIDAVGRVVSKTEKSTKAQVKELRRLAETNSTRYQQIQELLGEKFGDQVDVEVAQTYTLMSMIQKAFADAFKDLKHREAVRTRRNIDAANQRGQKNNFLKTKRDRVRTLQTLYTIEAENNRLTADKMAHDRRTASRKMNLAKERSDLMKKLANIEEDEKKLAEAIKDV